MSQGFAGMTASQYDAWRRSAEFHRIETAIVTPELAKIAARRVLDLGCGTGTWTRIIAALFPTADIAGVDIDVEMVNFAATNDPKRGIKYSVADCCRLGQLAAFDLIICGMSADYIGFDCVSRAVGDNLEHGGTALVWVLDPVGYEVRDGQRIKRWHINGEIVCTTAPVFDTREVCKMFQEQRLDVNMRAFPFTLADQKPRTLLVYHLARVSQGAGRRPTLA